MNTKRSKTTEITVETHEVVFTQGSSKAALAWCEKCRREVPMSTPEGAAHFAGVSPRTIYRWVEAGKIHFAESHAGSLLVCLDSISDISDVDARNLSGTPASPGREP